MAFPGSRFGELLVRWNRLGEAGFAAWDFLPGMRFGERAAWWREGGDRRAAHEGLDLCRYRTADGRVFRLGTGARVPAPWPGVVVSIVNDFLGCSVFIAHEPLFEGRRLHSVCGHVVPAAGLAVGVRLDEDGLVGAVAAGSATVPAHLHLSVALVAAGQRDAVLDWGSMRDPSRVRFVDPFPLLCGTMPAPERDDRDDRAAARDPLRHPGGAREG